MKVKVKDLNEKWAQDSSMSQSDQNISSAFVKAKTYCQKGMYA